MFNLGLDEPVDHAFLGVDELVLHLSGAELPWHTPHLAYVSVKNGLIFLHDLLLVEGSLLFLDLASLAVVDSNFVVFRAQQTDLASIEHLIITIC